jgi:histidyl-tRNA synthetase
MTEHHMFPADVQASGPAVLVTIFDPASAAESLRLAAELRRAGLRVELYPEADKLGKQFKYASLVNAAFVAILGSDELARGVVTIKNMTSGEQHAVARADAAAFVQRGQDLSPGVT